ncbi:hypothetical protein FDZ84_19135 [Saccharopolyspora sp. ASAGF58]|nr:hypothetical protein FDZ84_19135 [Saccharopolyspora sp. ASAGF58]
MSRTGGVRGLCARSPVARGSSVGVHDTVDKTWRHLDFFQHKAFLHARVPRVRCSEHGVRLVALPWARPGSGFTMLFEALVLTFAKAMPVARVAAAVREHDTRVWRVVEHHVRTARAGEDFSSVRRVGMDETSARREQDYISLFADLDTARVLFATEGRDAATVERRSSQPSGVNARGLTTPRHPTPTHPRNRRNGTLVLTVRHETIVYFCLSTPDSRGGPRGRVAGLVAHFARNRHLPADVPRHSALVCFDERVHVGLIHAGEGVRRQCGEHVRVGSGRRPHHAFPAAREIRGRALAAFAVRALRLGVVVGVPAPEPPRLRVGHA